MCGMAVDSTVAKKRQQWYCEGYFHTIPLCTSVVPSCELILSLWCSAYSLSWVLWSGTFLVLHESGLPLITTWVPGLAGWKQFYLFQGAKRSPGCLPDSKHGPTAHSVSAAGKEVCAGQGRGVGYGDPHSKDFLVPYCCCTRQWSSRALWAVSSAIK